MLDDAKEGRDRFQKSLARYILHTSTDPREWLAAAKSPMMN
jgi:hypothetical protein